jgi:hypothetical protein
MAVLAEFTGEEIGAMGMHWTWLITLASIVGTVANIYQKPWCFLVWLVTNITWCVYDLYVGEYSQAFLFGVYAVLACWGLWQWRRPGELAEEGKGRRGEGETATRQTEPAVPCPGPADAGKEGEDVPESYGRALLRRVLARTREALTACGDPISLAAVESVEQLERALAFLRKDEGGRMKDEEAPGRRLHVDFLRDVRWRLDATGCQCPGCRDKRALLDEVERLYGKDE